MNFARMWAQLRRSLNDKNSWGKNEVKALMKQIEQEELSIMLTGTPNVNFEPARKEINIKEISDMVLRPKGGF